MPGARHQGSARTASASREVADRFVGLIAIPTDYTTTWHRYRAEPVMHRDFAARCEEVSIDAVLPGDILLFGFGKGPAHHCGYAMPEERVIHCYREAGAVVEQDLRSWWRGKLRGAFRVPGAGPRDCQEFRVGSGDWTSPGEGLREALSEEDSELRLRHGPFTWRHFPLLLGSVQDQEQQFQGRFVIGKMPSGPNRASELGIQSLDGVRNRYEKGGAEAQPCSPERGVWCDHPGQRHREHEGAGRPVHIMSCELALVAGRLCDSPGCAESADP